MLCIATVSRALSHSLFALTLFPAPPPCPFLPYPILSYLALPCPALPCPALLWTLIILSNALPHCALQINAASQIIAGASRAVRHNLGLFTFEGDGVSLTKAMIDKYYSMGYSCYSTSRAGLFKVSVPEERKGEGEG